MSAKKKLSSSARILQYLRSFCNIPQNGNCPEMCIRDSFTVEEVNERRIEKVRVEKLPIPEEEQENEREQKPAKSEKNDKNEKTDKSNQPEKADKNGKNEDAGKDD